MSHPLFKCLMNSITTPLTDRKRYMFSLGILNCRLFFLLFPRIYLSSVLNVIAFQALLVLCMWCRIKREHATRMCKRLVMSRYTREFTRGNSNLPLLLLHVSFCSLSLKIEICVLYFNCSKHQLFNLTA